MKGKILLFVVTGLIAACDVSFNFANRSGSMEDDYVEEPLSGMAEEYAPILDRSNRIIEAIQEKDIAYLYSEAFDEELVGIISREDFLKTLSAIENEAGTIKSYKPMQWHMFLGKDRGRKLIKSVKIVEHENFMVNYLFVFDYNFDNPKLLGFFFKSRQGVLTPGQF